ncbi:major facilitator superfamily transporter [Paraphaeosphaeria sporulosa]|uniref:Major facilitator superfamily transporter n=1 Tax=Paraphaeosphaeria sporulosa TaxID=1460663 RepID=A0A177BXC8_9PLEO|nr:major facilitator superfamily transporter [Paraphaeosphaeria sporulosa]OAF99610.1 major facilitator superfamily transporter [Paraphaeosphaeria sporulosa]
MTATIHELNSTKELSQRSDDVQDESAGEPEIVQISPFSFISLMVGISLAVFLIALDRTIIANAIPLITDEFNSPDDAGWYGSAATCAFQPIFGRVFAHFDIRWSFLAALLIFELGSLICGVAPNSDVLIIGRALAGIGCAGVFAGCLVIIAMTTSLSVRPVYMGVIGSVSGIGNVCGPLIGGAFTSNATWRWCFYINLPVGGVTCILLLLFFHPSKSNRGQERFLTRVLRLDLIGNFILTVTVVMLLLALQWGGIEYGWGSSRIIGLLAASGVGFVIFGLWQHRKGTEALTPLYIMTQRGVAAGIGVMFFLSGAFLVHSYYLPYWFQAVRGRTPVQSGVDVTPYVATTFVFSMLAGIAVRKIGYFTPPSILGCAIGCVGCGLLTTLQVDTGTAVWAGYQVLTSAGMGMTMQQPIIAVQATIDPALVSIGSAIILFAQGLSGAIFVSVANNILRNELARKLVALNVPNVNKILAAGATDVRELVPLEYKGPLVEAYNDALMKVFMMAIPLCGIALLFALRLPWVNLKKNQAGKT